MEEASGPAVDIAGVRPAVTGLYLTLRCAQCETPFESYQPTVLCVPVGDLACPSCGRQHAVGRARFEAALAEHLPYQAPAEMRRLTAEATRVVESWHRSPVFSHLLRHRGVALGAAMERELLAAITLGLARGGQATAEEQGDQSAETLT